MLIPPLQNVQTPQRYSLVPRPTPPAPPLVDLLGRRKGLVPFLLGLVGLKSTARLLVTHEEVNCETTTFTGSSVELIPIARVADIHVAEYRPLPKAVLGAFFLFFGASNYFAADLAPLQIIGLLICVLGVALIVTYFLKRRLLIAIFSQSGLPIAVVLESGRIKNRLFGFADLVNIQRTIRMLAEAGGSGVPAPISHENSTPGFAADDVGEDDDAVEEEPDVGWQPPVAEAAPRTSPVEAEQTARRLLDDARRRAKAGDRDGAVKVLRELVEAYPDTTPAEQARNNLAKIGIRM
ncbi:hypothetical protein Pan44_33230 [Caulifigura coniformis]|uniref:Tetratricopeptide repeat protein n=1 Tax=Caulifigura coniformis TaxID=2527983 RepID=A0A517SGP1_9PLAN|nr:hypothetical protein [Caulifigura coniformis]QDT55280.1 hypothetical protein Pan44_33230 [Caulifigura coniformis]